MSKKTTMEKIGSKAADLAKDKAIDGAKSLAKDFDPKEIVNSGIFSLKGAQNSMRKLAAGDLQSFGQDLLDALVPSPDKLGAVMAVSRGVAQKEAVKNIVAEATSTGFLDQIASAKARGRRASSTAKKCAEPSCNKFHFRVDAYCTDHKHLGSHSGISLAESQTAALLNNADANPESNPELIHHLKAIALREEMMARAETYDIEITIDYIQDAKAALGKAAAVDDVELGQMFFQFKRLDADGDGAFTEADFATWINRIDPDFKNEEGVVNQWLRKVTVDGQDSFSFPGYYDMILAHRELENNNWGLEAGTEIPLEFRQTPFWDLRTVVLHALSKERCGWMLKRGYLFTKESLNSWKLRYLRTNTSRPYEPPTVEYWDADPNVDPANLPEGVPLPVMKGSIPLRDIVLVDFSPKTPSPRGTDAALLAEMNKVGMSADNEIVLKITLINGRRFTFACEQDKAVTWAAELSRHAAASRLMLDWRENWGTKRVGRITIRDWLNAAVVIAKIAVQKEANLDHKKIIDTAASKFTVLASSKAANIRQAETEASNYLKDVVLTDRDRMMLRVVGLEDHNIDAMGGVLIVGVKAWYAARTQLKSADDNYLRGGGQMAVNGVIAAVNVYNYAAAAKNAYNQNKWKVEWEPKSAQRACGVCMMPFKSMTLRKTHGKHHCRACGKVVCHVCAANRIYMSVSNKFERVCTKCLTDNDNRKRLDVALPDTVLGAVTNMVAETVLENMGGDDDSSSDSGGEN